MIDPESMPAFRKDWCSFAWFLGWAFDRFASQECRYLEWGPGWSTVYALASGLPARNIHSVESDPQYFERYAKLGVRLVLRKGPQTESVDEPVDREWWDPFPGERFHVILIDGDRKRDECAAHAASLLHAGGFVIVHDTTFSPEHRRAALQSGLRVLAESHTPPGATLLGRHEDAAQISAAQWRELAQLGER